MSCNVQMLKRWFCRIPYCSRWKEKKAKRKGMAKFVNGTLHDLGANWERQRMGRTGGCMILISTITMGVLSAGWVSGNVCFFIYLSVLFLDLFVQYLFFTRLFFINLYAHLFLCLFVPFVTSVLWHPSGDSGNVIGLCEDRIMTWDIDTAASSAKVGNPSDVWMHLVSRVIKLMEILCKLLVMNAMLYLLYIFNRTKTDNLTERKHKTNFGK